VVEPAPVTIGSDSWIAAESVVDGVDIPDGVVLGACSAALAGADALSPWTIAAGTPARSILPRSYAE
jgi:acetyltransferase-like isoleucine patch superfamily enzyme